VGVRSERLRKSRDAGKKVLGGKKMYYGNVQFKNLLKNSEFKGHAKYRGETLQHLQSKGHSGVSDSKML
jgi:hypothetical protein